MVILSCFSESCSNAQLNQADFIDKACDPKRIFFHNKCSLLQGILNVNLGGARVTLKVTLWQRKVFSLNIYCSINRMSYR